MKKICILICAVIVITCCITACSKDEQHNGSKPPEKFEFKSMTPEEFIHRMDGVKGYD